MSDPNDLTGWAKNVDADFNKVRKEWREGGDNDLLEWLVIHCVKDEEKQERWLKIITGASAAKKRLSSNTEIVNYFDQRITIEYAKKIKDFSDEKIRLGLMKRTV